MKKDNRETKAKREQINLRIPMALDKELTENAARQGVSKNALILNYIHMARIVESKKFTLKE